MGWDTLLQFYSNHVTLKIESIFKYPQHLTIDCRFLSDKPYSLKIKVTPCNFYSILVFPTYRIMFQVSNNFNWIKSARHLCLQRGSVHLFFPHLKNLVFSLLNFLIRWYLNVLNLFNILMILKNEFFDDFQLMLLQDLKNLIIS